MAAFRFHPDARKRFDNLATNIVARAVPCDEPQLRSRDDVAKYDIVPSHFLAPDMIKDVSWEAVEDPYTGELVRVWLRTPTKKLFGFDKEGCADLLRLMEGIYGAGQLRSLVDKEFLWRSLAAWIRKRLGETATLGMSDHLEAEISSAVDLCEVWIPIVNLHVVEDLPFGDVCVKPITRQVFDHWCSGFASQANSESDKAWAHAAIDQVRPEIQGHSALVAQIEAERGLAIRRAIDAAVDVAALLRIFEPGNASPLSVSGVDAFRRQPVSEEHAIVAVGGRCVERLARALPPMPSSLTIHLSALPTDVRPVFNCLSDLYAERSPTDFQKDLLSALLIYNRNSLARDLTDKLLFILVALESMLLKDTSEPIQKNIAERLAFVIRDDASARIAVHDSLMPAYEKRSSFVHHGQRVDDAGTVRPLMQYAWEFFLYMIRHHRSYKARTDLFKEIDRKKFA